MLYVKWPPRYADDGDEDFVSKEYDNMPKRPDPLPIRRPHKWDKLIRFVPGEQINNLLTDYDPVKNLLRINQGLYDLLPQKDQLMLWRLESNTELAYDKVVPTTKTIK